MGQFEEVENLAAAVSLHFMFYNFCRVSDHVWSLDELIGLLADAESVQIKRGRYAQTRAQRAANSN